MYWIYILKCNNGNFYTGYTNDLEKRYSEHLSGDGAKYTRSFKPIKIVQAWQGFIDRSLACKIESYIKKLKRIEKEELISNPEMLVQFFGSEFIAVSEDL